MIVVVLIVLMIGVNIMIKRAIYSDDDFKSAPVKAMLPAKNPTPLVKEQPPLPMASPVENPQEKNSATLQKPQKPGNPPSHEDKEIIYEPSIKSNILLQ